MAAKSKKSSSAHKPAPAKRSVRTSADTKAMNREIIETLFTDEERAGMFVAAHWKKLVALALLVVVAVTAGFAIFKHVEKTRKAATARLARTNTVADLEAELAKISDVSGVDAARFRLAKLYADQKKFDKAREVLKPIAEGSEDAVVRDWARVSRAYLLELDPAVQKADAAKEFDAISASGGSSLATRAEAAYAAARLYIDQKQPDKAKFVLDRIAMQLNAQTNSQSVAYWKDRITHLKHAIN